MTRNLGLVLASIPEGKPIPGKDLQVLDRPIDLFTAQPPKDGLLVRTHYCSLDPYLRGRMRDVSIASYAPAYPLNEPITNGSIATVLKSASAKFQEGDLVSISMLGPLEEYAAIPGDVTETRTERLENPLGLDVMHFTGALGMPGLTAYSSLYEIGRPKRGETIFVSAASGAVGGLVCQLAKREGLKVIGSVGSEEKLRYINEELGVDAGFNYKNETPEEALKRLAPGGIDIYFENVGGEHMSASLDAMKNNGRIVICGMISQYNLPPSEKYGVKNLQVIFEKSLTMRGFIVANKDFGPKYTEEHQKNVQQWLKDGSLKASMHITEGIENAAEALVGLFEGRNMGKSVLVVSEVGK